MSESKTILKTSLNVTQNLPISDYYINHSQRLEGFSQFEYNKEGILLSEDVDKGFKCYACIIEEYPEKIEEIRDELVETYKKAGYSGFSKDFDRKFDQSSVTFYISDQNNNILSTQRLSLKFQDDLLPIEHAIKKPKYPKLNLGKRVSEINSFYFKDLKSIQLLIGSIAKYSIILDIQKGYCLLDSTVHSLSNLYKRIGWSEEEMGSKFIFSSYEKINYSVSLPVQWRLMGLERHIF